MKKTNQVTLNIQNILNIQHTRLSHLLQARSTHQNLLMTEG